MSCTIIGLDPGSLNFGYSVLQSSVNDIKIIDFGVIKNTQDSELKERINLIHGKLSHIFEIHKPDIVSVEEIFYNKNVRSSIVLAHVRAIGLLLCAVYKAILKEYSPRKIKLSVAGNGSADKDAVKRMTCRILKINDDNINLNASDAMAAGLCAYFDSFNSINISKKREAGFGKKWDLNSIQSKNLKIKGGT